MSVMATVRRATPVSKAPAALSTVLALLVAAMFAALFASCGADDGRIGAGTTAGEAAGDKAGTMAVTQDDAGPALLAMKPGRAVLVEGTAPVKGLPGFGRNALAALYGKYAFPQDSVSPPLEIELWFTREILVMPAAWGKAPCRTQPFGFTMLAATPEADGSALWSLAGSEYTLLMRMPPGMASPCAFIAVLADRFSFFYRYSARPEDVSFPAILDIQGGS
jgi:hypothetical protein